MASSSLGLQQVLFVILSCRPSSILPCQAFPTLPGNVAGELGDAWWWVGFRGELSSIPARESESVSV